MPKYLVEVSYTSEGAKGLLAGGGTARRKAVEEMAAAASAVALRVAASGAARTKTSVLITPEEVDEAAKQQLTYRPPGQ